MNWLKNKFFSPYITWRLIEWILLLGNLISIFFSSHNFLIRPYRFQLEIAFIIIFFLLSFIFPINRPIWQKRVYFSIEICLINLALLNAIEFDNFMFFVLAKACFLLKRKDAIITIVLTGITNLSAFAWVVPDFHAESKEYIKSNGIEKFVPPLSELLLNYVIDYVAISFFLTLLMFLFIAESKSRKKAEKLAQEVEILATALERNRIARDIHDSLGHTLTTLGVQLELAQKLHGINSERANQALKNAQQLASQSLTEVRNTVSAIRDKNFNLKRALNELVNQFRKDNLFEIKLQLNLPSLTLQTSHQIYCIVKESLYNVQKHSQASLVILNSRNNSESIIIEIADNGIGFNSYQINSGSGLKGMLERSQLINGQLKIDTVPNQGTRIQLIIPVIND